MSKEIDWSSDVCSSDLDEPGPHALDGDRGVHEVGSVLGVENSGGCDADDVSGPTNALEAAGSGWRGFDLDDKVDGPHVDP